jgi:hypothetical protein
MNDKYPEHAKLRAVVDESQAIGTFLDMGLADQSLVLCRFQEGGNNGEPRYVWFDGLEKDYEPTAQDYFGRRADHNPDYEAWDDQLVLASKPIPEILAHYFDVDQDRLDEEKRRMLEEMAETNDKVKNA